MASNRIYHLVAQSDWNHAQQAGTYEPASLQREGFIHLSTAAQVGRVANSFYRGQGGLVVLAVEPERLTSTLKWEAPAHPGPTDAPPTDELFPHLYGPLNLNAVAAVIDFPPNPDGSFPMPNEVT